MGLRRYEDFIAWQLSRELERRVFEFTATVPALKDVDYCRQVRLSSASAARNLSEGFGRFLPADFARFARITIGSLHETRDHLDAGLERGYLSKPLHDELTVLANRAIGASVRLVRYLDTCASPLVLGMVKQRRRRRS